MKRLLSALLALCLLCTGCSIPSAPQRALTRMLGALQDGNIAKAERYTTEGFPADYSTRKAKKLYKAMFASMDYVVAKTEVQGDAAEILVTVTMVDMATLVSDASLNMLDQDLRGSAKDKKLYTLLRDKIKAEEVEYVTNTVVVNLVRQEDGWRVNMTGSTKFANAITGGMSSLLGY